jgi:hypothetical protein
MFHCVNCIVKMVKVKVKTSLCLTKHHAMKAYWGSGGIAPCILYPPRERAPGTHWIGGWLGPRAVLDVVVKGKIPSPCWESNPRTLIIQPIAQHYSDWAVMAHIKMINSNLNLRNRVFLPHNKVCIYRGVKWMLLIYWDLENHSKTDLHCIYEMIWLLKLEVIMWLDSFFF